MWWAIGIGALVLLVFLFAKVRAASHQIQLATAARNHLNVSYRMMNIVDRGIDERVWCDPYLLGYGQGSLALMTHHYGHKLSTVQKGMVTVNALKELAGDRYGEVCERMARLHEKRDPEFMRGMLHGSNVAILMVGKPGTELLADPDVQAALSDAPSTERMMSELDASTASQPFTAAGAALMQTYLHRHKLEASY